MSEDLVTNNKLKLDESLVTSLSEPGQSQHRHRRHPGMVNCRRIRLPDTLLSSVDYLIQKYPTNKLRERSDILTRQLWSRKLPVESIDIDAKAAEIRSDLEDKDEVDWENLTLKEQEEQQLKYKNKAISKLNKSLYHWKPINYTSMIGFTYMCSRLANDYAVIYRLLNEIKSRDTAFKPQRLLDVGSGVGSNVWAANTLWAESLTDYSCVDISEDMNTIARLLIQDGKEDGAATINNVFYRRSMYSDQQTNVDLVISSFTLMELPDQKSRLNYVLSLWRKTSNYLVLAENGSNAGFKAILEARDFLLQLGEKGFPELVDEAANIFSPCPHNGPCPRFLRDDRTPCNFIQNYQKIEINKHKGEDIARFSYVVFKKGNLNHNKWPRIVRPTTKASRKVNCRICSLEGELQSCVITAKKNGKDLYWCARNSSWGDMLPSLTRTSDTQNSSTIGGDCNDTKPTNTSNTGTKDTTPDSNNTSVNNNPEIQNKPSTTNDSHSNNDSSNIIGTTTSTTSDTHDSTTTSKQQVISKH